jgi:uncharacterized protein
MEIRIEKPTPQRLAALGVASWPIWEKEVSTFDWTYDEEETCYLLEGQVRVEPTNGGEAVDIGKGDLVTFPAGLSCVWRVTKPVRKHYRFG